MNFNVKTLFAVPYFETNLEVSDEIISYVNKLEYVRTDYNNSDISVKRDVLEQPFFYEYVKQIDLFVNKFAYDILNINKQEIKFERISSWVNIHHYGDWAQEHSHSNSIISGVWYLKVPKNSGMLVFDAPYYNFPLQYSVNKINCFNSYGCGFVQEKGKLCLFPSSIRHSVGKNSSYDSRICLAFNYYSRGTVISEGSYVKI